MLFGEGVQESVAINGFITIFIDNKFRITGTGKIVMDASVLQRDGVNVEGGVLLVN